jgi:hypothetical protein
LVWGLVNRKKRKTAWINEERFEESGSWIDKRSGERGTYGSLDDEMEANRQHISLQSKVSELAQSIQSEMSKQLPEFQTKTHDDLKRHFSLIKSELLDFFVQCQGLLKGKSVRQIPKNHALNPLATHLKKSVLNYSYQHFPELLQLDIKILKQLDDDCEIMCNRILSGLSTEHISK